MLRTVLFFIIFYSNNCESLQILAKIKQSLKNCQTFRDDDWILKISKYTGATFFFT